MLHNRSMNYQCERLCAVIEAQIVSDRIERTCGPKTGIKTGTKSDFSDTERVSLTSCSLPPDFTELFARMNIISLLPPAIEWTEDGAGGPSSWGSSWEAW